jgi:hypothetical protein
MYVVVAGPFLPEILPLGVGMDHFDEAALPEPSAGLSSTIS